MNVILHPTYFPNVAAFVALANSETVIFEKYDNFQKQSYRNRMYIYGANGKLQVSIPICHAKNGEKIKYTNTQILNIESWQKQHWKSIESAYKSSPFFEYYQDELQTLFFTPHTNLFELNKQLFLILCECIELDINIKYTSDFFKTYENENTIDLRYLAQSKKEIPIKLNAYTQVFVNKHGYLNNLSILDLLFNEGPNTLNYLDEQTFFWKKN